MREDQDSIQASLSVTVYASWKGDKIFHEGTVPFQEEAEINGPEGPNISKNTVRGGPC